MTDSLWWYTARAGGLVAAALLAASVIMGLALSTAPRRARPKTSWRLDLHRFLGGLACVFVVVHVAGILFDRFVPFGLTDVLVPLASRWHPWAVALGVVALYLLVAVEVTSLLKARMPLRIWRGLHYLSFPLFAAVQAHVLLAGTDRNSPWVLFAIVACDLVIAALLTRRGLASEGRYDQRERFRTSGRTA
jgi:DMSO/TMAO reductase YedYZ heme-binding membrane subunit